MAERTCSSCHLLSLCFSHMSSLPRSTSQWQLCPLHVSVIPLAVKDLFFSTSLHFPCPGLLKGSLGLACAAEGRKATSSLCSCVLVQVPVCEVTEHLSDPGGCEEWSQPVWLMGRAHLQEHFSLPQAADRSRPLWASPPRCTDFHAVPQQGREGKGELLCPGSSGTHPTAPSAAST